MRAKATETSTRDLANWSEPLIADYIFSAYENLFGGPCDVAETLARQHCRMWRNLLHGQPTIAAYLRRELTKAVEIARLAPDAIDTIDMGVFEHLLEVVMRKGARTRDLARNEGMTLVAAASTLGEIRKVA
jgi:hypothetical protein